MIDEWTYFVDKEQMANLTDGTVADAVENNTYSHMTLDWP
jgi:hypothetical protein